MAVIYHPPRVEDYISAWTRPRIEIEPEGSINEIYTQILPKLESVIGEVDVDIVRSEKGDRHHWIVRILPTDGNKRTERYLQCATEDLTEKHPELKGRIDVTSKLVLPEDYWASYRH